MGKTEYENHEPLDDSEQEEIGGQILAGNTSGILDREDGTRVAWKLNWNKWKE